MYKTLLILALSSAALCDQQDLAETFLNNRAKRQFQGGPSSIVQMTGSYNYHADQQVFFMNSLPQKLNKGFKSCLSFLERDDYTVTPEVGVHKLHLRKRKWNHARKSCMEEGGHLAVINTAREEKVIQDLINKENLTEAYIGIHDLYEEGDWVTLTGENVYDMPYVKWSTLWPNLPDNYGGNQNCGVLRKEGGMDDVDCALLHPYVCEIEFRYFLPVQYTNTSFEYDTYFASDLLVSTCQKILQNFLKAQTLIPPNKNSHNIGPSKISKGNPLSSSSSTRQVHQVLSTQWKEASHNTPFKYFSVLNYENLLNLVNVYIRVRMQFPSINHDISYKFYVMNYFLPRRSNIFITHCTYDDYQMRLVATQGFCISLKILKREKSKMDKGGGRRTKLEKYSKLDNDAFIQSWFVCRECRFLRRSNSIVTQLSKKNKFSCYRRTRGASLIWKGCASAFSRNTLASSLDRRLTYFSAKSKVNSRRYGDTSSRGRCGTNNYCSSNSRTMYLLFLFCLFEGTLCDTLVDVRIDDLNLTQAHNFKERVTRAIPGSDQPTICQNVYEASNQLFHVQGKQWKADSVKMKPGYVLTRGIGVHKLYKQRSKWNAARKTCQKDGAELAVLNSLAEETMLIAMMRQSDVATAWVGVHDLFEEGDWVTITGESMEKAGYHKWSRGWPNLPDNYGGNQNCGALEFDGIDDVDCSWAHSFFCEINVY
ncbi:uncharacterized protein LOC143180171 [Calliopsis andreniformis]|uniref:uncharacterized protein LOC143180171 n=1 Tax=Calliopsis andreniformis TaxID=337506 RepID=UPI003FCCFE61